MVEIVFRSRDDVGHACRGSLNLHESQIVTDPSTCNLVINFIIILFEEFIKKVYF